MRFFPAMSFAAIMMMDASAFFALNSTITRLQAEEEAIALITAHGADPQKRLDELFGRIKDIKRGPSSKEYVLNPLMGEASYEEKPGAIAELRARQKAAAEKIKQDRQAWLEALKEQKQRENNPTT